MSESLNLLHLTKAALVKELLWLRNNPLLDYDGDSKQLLQEVQTVQNLKWKSQYPPQPLAYSSLPKSQQPQTPVSRVKTLGLSFKYPFTSTEVLPYKRSYSHQPNVLEHVEEVGEQVRKDAYILRRVSELEKQGLLKSRILPKTGPQGDTSTNRAALHAEMEQMAEVCSDSSFFVFLPSFLPSFFFLLLFVFLLAYFLDCFSFFRPLPNANKPK
jgi:hypothetical protein